MSALDIKAGFHNIPIAGHLQRYCGLATQDGVFVAQCMQFGFKSAPAHFQHVMHTALECEICEWVEPREGEAAVSVALGDPGLRSTVRAWLREIAPRFSLEECECAARGSLGAGCEVAWVVCSDCGYPHLDSGENALVVHSQFKCGACGSSFRGAAPVVANPLAAWNVALKVGTLVVRRREPGVTARGSNRVLAVDDTILAVEGLPTASSAELGVSRIQE